MIKNTKMDFYCFYCFYIFACPGPFALCHMSCMDYIVYQKKGSKVQGVHSFKYEPSSIRSCVDFYACNTKLYNNFAMLYFPYLTIFRNENVHFTNFSIEKMALQQSDCPER